MNTAIDNLKKVQRVREILIMLVMGGITKPMSNCAYEREQERVENLPFKSLHNRMVKLYGKEYKETYNLKW